VKAIIISNERGGSYVMDHDGVFSFVYGYASLPVGTEIEIKERPNTNLTKIVSLAACFVLAVSFVFYAWLWNATQYYVYVDINPSVEMQFNRFDRAINTEPLDPSGAELLNGLTLRGTSDHVVVSLIDAAVQKNFLDPSDAAYSVLITVVATGGRTPDDDGQAAAWCRKAADHGHAVAQEALAVMYQDGRGVARDRAQVVAWHLACRGAGRC